MSAKLPAAELSINGICHDIALAPLPVGHRGYDVTFVNGRAQIVVPLGVTEDGQEAHLRVTDPQILSTLVFLATVGQGRMGVRRAAA